jgi:hypothetical protein
MWIVFRTDTFEIIQKCYSKFAAKQYIKSRKFRHMFSHGSFLVDMDKVDFISLEKWHAWKILAKK